MIFRFGEYELDGAHFELRRAGSRVGIERRVFDVLWHLVKNAHRVVSKAELLDQVWDGRKVAEGSLTVAISAARRALGDDATRQQMIRTTVGRGYRFVGPLIADPSKRPLAPTSRLPTMAPDFIGRSGEIATIQAFLDAPDASALLISGEPGIGKSRLLAELAKLATSRAIPVHIVSCPESERTPSLWPCVQILRKLAATCDSNWREAVPARHAVFLHHLLPDLFSKGAESSTSDPDAARFQLFEAMTLAIAALSQGRRTLLAIDDFQRSDPGTARFLPFCLRELRGSSILIVTTFRSTETPPSELHANAILALAREPGSVHLQLDGLSLQETIELVRTLSARPPSDELAHQLYERTSGNPFFIRQLVPLLSDTATTDAWRSVPPTISQAILARVGSHTSETQRFLRVAAVVGRNFCPRLVASVCEDLDATRCLDEAIAGGLVQTSGDGTGRASFLHVLVRDALYARLSTAERQALHAAIGRYLDTTMVEPSETHAAEAAHHLAAAANPEALRRATELAEQAAISASHRSAYDDAAHLYAQALRTLALVDPSAQARRCDLLLARGKSEGRAGDRAKARETFREVASLARTLRASRALADAALALAPGFLAAEAGVSDASLESLLSDAIEALGLDSDFDLRARLAARLAMALHWTEQDTRMHELMSEARALLTQTPDQRARLHVLFAEWFCGWKPENFDQRYAIAEEIGRLSTAVRDEEMSLVAMVLRMVGMLERGELSSFDAILLQFNDLARRLRQPQSLWYSPMYEAMRALLDGQLERALDLQGEFAYVASRVGDANAFHSLVVQSALVRWERGELESILPAIEEGTRRYPVVRGFRAGLAWAYLQIGRRQDAMREFERLAANDFCDIPERYDWSAAVGFAAEVCTRLGDRRRSKLLYPLLRPLKGRFLVIGLGVAVFGPADRLLGMLAAASGEPEKAEWHFEAALSLAIRSGTHLWTAHTKLDYAEFLLRNRRSSRSLAQRLKREAQEFSAELGLNVLERRAAAVGE